ncbi:MAG: ribbon-helix-helix domain-containing protein [Gemmatimonadaceae bacterium]
MAKRTASPPSRVREPVQVYLEADDSSLLARLAATSGLSKAEVMRRGMRAFAREQDVESPMLAFFAESVSGEWPAGVAADHDAVLAESYLGHRGKRR